MSVQSEGKIKSDIMTYLRALPGCYARIVQVGRIPGRTNHSKGISDIIAVVRGAFVAIEVKKPGEKTTPEQDEFLECVRRCGGLAIVAYSLDDVVKALQTHRIGMSTMSNRKNNTEAVRPSESTGEAYKKSDDINTQLPCKNYMETKKVES